MFSGLCTQYFKEQVYNKMLMWGLCAQKPVFFPCYYTSKWSHAHLETDWGINQGSLSQKKWCVHLPPKWGNIEDVWWGLGSVNTDIIMHKSTSSHCAQLKGEPRDGGKADGSSQVLLLFLTGIQGQTQDSVSVCIFCSYTISFHKC